jgi:hypothetical protein
MLAGGECLPASVEGECLPASVGGECLPASVGGECLPASVLLPSDWAWWACPSMCIQ